VEYIDNTVIGEMSVPDMRMCVQYAVDYPDRFEGVGDSLDFTKLSQVTFAAPDYEAFPLLGLAKRALFDGGALAAVLKSADEIAVGKFLNGEISFADVSEAVMLTYEKMSDARRAKSLEEIIESDRKAREFTIKYKQ
jgi:1-deoxy-D-xylulose-5-phosphate reductoisomerase